jgi:hypothetical protein
MTTKTRKAEQVKLDAFRAELTPLEEGRCPLETLPGTEHYAQHPSNEDCTDLIVAKFRAIQERIQSTAWTPRSTEATIARNLHGRITTDIEVATQPL